MEIIYEVIVKKRILHVTLIIPSNAKYGNLELSTKEISCLYYAKYKKIHYAKMYHDNMSLLGFIVLLLR